MSQVLIERKDKTKYFVDVDLSSEEVHNLIRELKRLLQKVKAYNLPMYTEILTKSAFDTPNKLVAKISIHPNQ